MILTFEKILRRESNVYCGLEKVEGGVEKFWRTDLFSIQVHGLFIPKFPGSPIQYDIGKFQGFSSMSPDVTIVKNQKNGPLHGHGLYMLQGT